MFSDVQHHDAPVGSLRMTRNDCVEVLLCSTVMTCFHHLNVGRTIENWRA